MSRLAFENMEEFSQGWPLILACFIGMMVGLTALPFYSYGVFAESLEQAFGWNRAQSQSGLLFQTFGVLGVLPFLGGICDRYGIRRVAITSMALFALCFACLSLINGSLWQYRLITFTFGVLGAGTLPITWTRAVNGAFDKNRGLALGLALMGTGFVGILTPILAGIFIEDYGWRVAYLTLAALPGLIGLPVVIFLFKEKTATSPKSSNTTKPLVGLSFSTAFKDYRFWLIGIGFMVVSFGIGGSIQNLFPYFTGEGFKPGQATALLSTIGVSVIFGRLSTGFFLDRFWGPGVAAILMMLPAISCFILSAGSPSLFAAYFATILIGFAAGAEFDIIAFLASRYFGLKDYNKIYSFLYAAFALGAAAAPLLYGMAYDRFGNYSIVFLISAGLFLLGSVMLLFLGRYPNYGSEQD